MTFAFSGAGDSIGLTVDWDGSTTVATTVAFKIDSLFGADTSSIGRYRCWLYNVS